MKIIPFLFYLCFCQFLLNAQDLIVRKNGDKFHCIITKEDSADIYFTCIKNHRQFDTYIVREDIAKYRFGNKHGIPANIEGSDLKICFTTGFMYGGGAIFGYEIERKLYNRISFQHGHGYSTSTKQDNFNLGLLHLGSSFISFGFGLNYHLKYSLRSSYISLQYWRQGAIYALSQSTVGPVFVYRGKKWFTAQIGLGYVFSKSKDIEFNYNKSPFKLTYAIGFYLIG
jgi:hypothetical protein